MPYSIAGRNAMLDALGALITHVGLLDAGTALTSVTGTASTDTFTKNSHGMGNGTLVVLSSLSGGTGLVEGRPYYVVNTATNTFKLSHVSGGSAVDYSTDVSGVTVTPLVEITGGSPAYARKAIAWNAAADGTMDDSTNGAVFDVPGGATVDYVGYYSASSAGTLHALDDVTTPESFAAQGTYTITDADLDLLAAGGN